MSKKFRWYTGKPGSVLTLEERAVFDSQPLVTRCGLCDWSHHGNAAEGRSEALTHRLEAHPEIKQKRRRPYRGSFNPSFQMNDDDSEQVEADRQRRARLHGVQLSG